MVSGSDILVLGLFFNCFPARLTSVISFNCFDSSSPKSLVVEAMSGLQSLVNGASQV